MLEASLKKIYLKLLGLYLSKKSPTCGLWDWGPFIVFSDLVFLVDMIDLVRRVHKQKNIFSIKN